MKAGTPWDILGRKRLGTPLSACGELPAEFLQSIQASLQCQTENPVFA